jgi:hypothetical protein
MPFGKTCLCIDLMSLGRPQQLCYTGNICECNYHEIVLQGSDYRYRCEKRDKAEHRITSSQPMNKRGGTRYEISLEFIDRKLCLLSIQEII